MTLTNKQEEALKIAVTRYKNGEKFTVITGYAGSGKSTIIPYIIQALNLNLNQVKFVTFTGKAALVLQQKGLPATTIHKLIYYPRKLPNGKFYFEKKKKLSAHTKLIVIDEISMVSNKLLKDLMSFNIHLLCLGDPFQVMPVKDSDNDLILYPDIFLDEIHRQAKDNSIIRLSMEIREGKPLTVINNDPDLYVCKKDELSFGMLHWADQCLCATNKTRKILNQRMRENLGFSGDLPNVGDKITCLHNYWEIMNDDCCPLINGTIGTVEKVSTHPNSLLKLWIPKINFKADYTDSIFYNLFVDRNIFNDMPPLENVEREIQQFDYGYVLSTHRSQGSQWDKVLVIEEQWPFNKIEHARLLYTGITRASKKLVVIKK